MPAVGSVPSVMLGEALAKRDNALNFIRLMLAAAVIVGHSYYLTDIPAPSAWVNPLLPAWAVNGFFAISGFLIAGSRLRLSFGTYLARRARRVMPGFWTVLVVVAFVVSPLVALLVGETWHPGSALTYVAKNAGLWIWQPVVEDTLAGTPTGDASWNVPLWTLSYEAACYVVFGLVLGLRIVRRNGFLFFGVALAVLMAVHPLVMGPEQNDMLKNAVRLASFFVAGVVCWYVRDRIPLRWWVPVVAVACLAVLSVVTDGQWYGQLPAAVALLSAGGLLPIRVGVDNDISYGVYIYGWPVQQTLAALGAATMGVALFLVLSLALVLPVAWASWMLVERRWLPQRRARVTSGAATVRAVPVETRRP